MNTSGDEVDGFGGNCERYDEHELWCGHFDTPNFKSYEMCCACGGGEVGSNTLTVWSTRIDLNRLHFLLFLCFDFPSILFNKKLDYFCGVRRLD